jgi:hypothetical protein
MGTARTSSAAWAQFLFLRHTQITLTNTENLSVASLWIDMGNRLLTQEISIPVCDPHQNCE